MSQKQWECYLAGRLVEEDEFPGKWAVFVNNKNSIQFSLRVLSATPEALSGVQYFTCWSTKLRDFDDDGNTSESVRVASLKSYLQGKIVLFKPIQTVVENSRYALADSVVVLDAPGALNRHSRLVPILNLTDARPDEFEDRVFNRRAFGPYDTFGKDMPVVDPAAVWVRDRLYGPFRTMRPTPGGSWFLAGDEIRKVDVDLAELASLILPYKNVIFIDEDTYLQELVPRLTQSGIPLDRTIASRVEAAAPPAVLAPADPAQADPAKGSSSGAAPSENGRQAGSGGRTVTTPSVPPRHPAATDGEALAAPVPDPVSEGQFLHRFKQLARAKGLLYDEGDLVNFHTAVKTGSLVLLSGMSGIGKTQMVQVYAEALGLGEKQFRIIPVRPTWTDGSDLMGFLDLTHHLYRPADTGLLELLVDADRNRDRLYIVCFDEMNLARVEHYFAQFISVLELEPGRRWIDLYSSSDEARIYNSDRFPHRVAIGPNVRFVGTVNVDESTYAFSDKVLDRAQVIRPRVLPFSTLHAWLDEKVTGVECPEIPFTVYDGWTVRRDGIALTTDEVEFLEQIHDQLHRIDEQRGIGYRTLRQIDAYLQNIPLHDGQPMIERSVAFDWQLVQKVFTRLRGPREQLEPLVGHVNPQGEVEGSALIQLMEQYAHLGNFTRSRAEIERRAKELAIYGYTS